jgi:hypothetical protein
MTNENHNMKPQGRRWIDLVPNKTKEEKTNKSKYETRKEEK